MRIATLPALPTGYRNAAVGATMRAELGQWLRTASDALTLAVLTVEGRSGDDRGDKLRRAEQARQFLVEATRALGRARVYLPKLRTHALPVLLASESNPDAELARLHQMATRLLWQNHTHLPARMEAIPLLPEEEKQLAVMVAGVTRGARIDRALRYRWCGVALAAAAVGLMGGFPLLGAAAAAGGVGLALFRLLRHEDYGAAANGAS
jgi:hypothetical protein